MPGHAQRSDVELLHDTEEPAQSFATFYRRHVGAILRFAARRNLDADTAADVVAETFFAALAGRARYRPESDSARLWLLGIAARQAADVHRKRAKELRKEERLRHEAVTITDADRDDYRRLLDDPDEDARNVLGDLPEAQQHAIRARVLEHRDYAEIARDLGLSEPAARQRVSRGLAALRAKLGKEREP